MIAKDDDFFEQLKLTLVNYHEPLPKGAWERFAKKEKNRKAVFYYRTLGIAASILIFIFLITNIKITEKVSPGDKNNTHQFTKSQPIHKKLNTKDIAVNPSVQAKLNPTNSNPSFTLIKVLNKPHLPGNRLDYNQNPAATTESAVIQWPQKPLNPSGLDLNLVDLFPDSNIAEKVTIITTDKRDKKDALLWLQQNSKDIFYSKKIAPADEAAKWKTSFQASPGLGNQSVNYSAGVRIARKIDKHFSLTSGISFLDMNALKNFNMQVSQTPNKQLQSVNASFSGIEVPFEIHYHLPGNFYLASGVSAFVIFKNQFQYNYLVQTITTITTTGAGGQMQLLTEVTQEKSQEISKESINNYVGFYTLSAGRDFKFKKQTISIAPYARLPFGKISSQDFRLLGGGLTLSIGF